MNPITIVSLFVYVAVTTSVILPELHVIKRISFKYPYSCQPGPLSYEGCALFITDYGVSRNMPDLLYNGACGSDNFFEVMLAGDDFGMLSDLGDVPLENVTASKAFNYENMAGQDNRFFNTINVVKGHTYAALLAKEEIRALFVFRVESYEKSGAATIAYAVKQYGVIQSVQEAPGFSWVEPNH
ncbi:unnamed protein product [Rotaria magnacalcarata]|uniref:Uncharacterized protein n=3 Tax=Rotaria magnacalcarata TaxID=392030 RepID=A0A819WA43_9BILA|nr:unnamed protein product [Rotaria magnacalcarata]CAF1644046.1 unnamed protein product [Rotaria magnacalcarata]CAF2043787.1 unnamed protein product [Rotaria magnacalcarata]CAF2144770.1 unnamed protein product [Rotaria magnacalcarata]CAF3786382.1 unnamed protein product [Rotaria magnacalcarata]